MAFTPNTPIPPYYSWTDFTPTVPEFYWNVHSAEERIKKICFEMNKLCEYVNTIADDININHVMIDELQKALENIENIDELDAKVRELEAAVGVVQRILENLPDYAQFLTLESNVNSLDLNKVNWPVNPNSKYGTEGQILKTNGNGTTMWVDPISPTDAQAETYINAWLNSHPEATTTVQDGSITPVKLSTETQDAVGNFGRFANMYGIIYGESNSQMQLIDYDDPDVTTGGYINQYGVFVESTTVISSGYIPIIPGMEYTIHTVGIQYVVLYNINKTYISAISTTSISGGSKFIGPSNAIYVRLPILANGTTRVTCNAWYSDYASNYEFSRITDTIEFSKNLFDKNAPDCTYGSYMNANGEITENPSFMQSGYIPIKIGTRYSATLRNSFVLWFDADKNLIGSTPSHVFGANGYVEPIAGACYAKFLFTVATVNSAQVFEGVVETEADIPPYHAFDWARFKNTNNDIYNPYYGLSGVAFGTSLTYRAQTAYGYLTTLENLSAMEWDNKGLGASTILPHENIPNMYDVITSYTHYADMDVAILEGFVNDWYYNTGTLLGTWNDTNLNTVCGRVRSAINHIFSQNQNITLFLVLDHYGQSFTSSTSVNSGNQTQFEYYSEVEKVALSMGVRVIREFELSEISERTPQYLVDNIHLTELGAIQSGTCIWDAMKTKTPNARSNQS